MIDYDEYEKKPKVDGEVGVDVGIKSFAVTSEGVVYPKISEDNPTFSKCDKMVKKYNRKLSKTESDSKRHHRVRVKLAKWHKKKANIRENYHHNVSSQLIRENQMIAVENLNVSGMLKNHKLAKAIQDHGLSNFFRILTYKSYWNDREIVEVGRFFASSKLCNCCGYKNNDLTLADREWICPVCGEKVDRDLNAAVNILEEGKRLRHSLREDDKRKVLPTQSETRTTVEFTESYAQGLTTNG